MKANPVALLKRSLILPCALFAVACADSKGGGITDPITPPVTGDTTSPPALVREMRGMWIATVANIDWPSRTTLTAEQQKAELVDILNRAASTGINTVILQVRPAADALYPSSLEPWAALLTGTQGTDPGYDPLAFAIGEAHARGMELHAWVNLFRVGNTSDSLKMASSQIFKARRDLVRVYGTQLWMDPGEPEVHDRSIAVIKDIVSRYDIDGLHTDDFYYPYVQTDATGKTIAFPDSATFARYGNGLSLADWRRANVDRFIERMYREVHSVKPKVKVGIAPFGIWRPGNPASVQGLDAYASIYADSRKWLQQGWLDYMSPQLYWAISAPQQSYPALLDWWISQNLMGRHIWPGLASYRVNNGTTSAFTLQEIPDQIKMTRTRAGSTGNLLYNTTWTLKQNSSALANALSSDVYKDAALVPASPWLDNTPPPTPSLTFGNGFVQIIPASGESPRWYAVRVHSSTGWKTQIIFAATPAVSVTSNIDRVLVQAVDQAGNVSGAAEWKRP